MTPIYDFSWQKNFMTPIYDFSWQKKKFNGESLKLYKYKSAWEKEWDESCKIIEYSNLLYVNGITGVPLSYRKFLMLCDTFCSQTTLPNSQHSH